MSTAEEEARGAADFLFSLMEHAWNGGDVEAYSQLYGEDVGYVNRYGDFFQNRDEVARIHAEAFAGRFKGTKLRILTRRFRLLSPDSAVVHVDVFTTENSSDPAEVRAIATIVLCKRDANWHVAALHVSDIDSQQ